jgi:uncharacterized protein (TIGR03437 family)
MIDLGLRERKPNHVKTFFAIVLTLGLLASAGFAQPTITQVSNAASSALTPLPNSAIAQGSYFAIYGSGFGSDTTVCGSSYENCFWTPYPLPTNIKGTSVSVTVGGTTVPAYIEFAAKISPTYSQINAVLPSTTPTGTGTLTVTTNGATSAAFPVTVAASSVGTFAVNQAGTGPGVITDAKYQFITPFHTAKPGDFLILWGTGLGPAPDTSTEGTAPPAQTNLCSTPSSCPVTVWVAGQKASVQYAGRSGFTAEDQIVFIVPPGVQGCYVQVAVQTGSVVGNFTSMSVDPNGATCSDADGIDYNSISAMVGTKGQAKVGAISMLSNYLNLKLTGLSALQWDNDTVSGEIGTFTQGQLNSFQSFTLAPSVGNCAVSPFLQYPPPTDPVLSSVAYLDAGSTLSIQGPNGTMPIAKNPNGKGYSALVGGATIAQLIQGGGGAPFFLSPTFGISSGTYTVTAPGGADVGPFTASITVPSSAASFQWTNQPTGAISRSSPLTITWTGGDPNGFVDITAISSTLASGIVPPPGTPGILVECIAPASTGSFTIPTYVLQSLASTAGSTAIEPPGELLVGPASAPVKATTPTGLDALYIFYHYIQGLNVTWQ